MAEAGEALIVRHRAEASDRLPVPMQVRVLEPDYLVPWIDGSRAIGKIGEQFAVMVGAFGTPDYSAPAAMQVA